MWPDLDDEGEAKWREHKGEGRYIELSRGPFATTRTPTYGTNNRINFAVDAFPYITWKCAKRGELELGINESPTPFPSSPRTDRLGLPRNE